MGRMGRTRSGWPGAPNAGGRSGRAAQPLRLRRSGPGRCAGASPEQLEPTLPATKGTSGCRAASEHRGRIAASLALGAGVLGPVEARAVRPSSRRDHDPRYQKPPSKQPPLRRSAAFTAPVHCRRAGPRRPTGRRGQRFSRAPLGSQGELTAPAYERSQRVEEGGPGRQAPSVAGDGGRIDARLEKAACAFERAPRVGLTDAHPGPRLRPAEHVTRAGLTLQAASTPRPRVA